MSAIDLAEDREVIQVSTSLTQGDLCSSNSVKVNFFDHTIWAAKQLLLDLFHGCIRVDLDNRLVGVVDFDDTFAGLFHASLDVHSGQPTIDILE